MPKAHPRVLALDFDGVLCDGLIEYFQAAWRTYCQIWSPPSNQPSDELVEHFYRLRPVIETGWEMPVLVRALVLGRSEAEILQDWPAIAQQILVDNNLQAKDLAAALDRIRDQWIATDVESWLALHRFYSGVIDRLKTLRLELLDLVIISTKEGRFIQQLLQEQGVELSKEKIFGKETQRPKHQLLRELIAAYPEDLKDTSQLWFIEDRLKTLQSVQKQADLSDVRLYLADWGYNTATDRNWAKANERIQLLSLDQFSQDFLSWL